MFTRGIQANKVFNVNWFNKQRNLVGHVWTVLSILLYQKLHINPRFYICKTKFFMEKKNVLHLVSVVVKIKRYFFAKTTFNDFRERACYSAVPDWKVLSVHTHENLSQKICSSAYTRKFARVHCAEFQLATLRSLFIWKLLSFWNFESLTWKVGWV